MSSYKALSFSDQISSNHRRYIAEWTSRNLRVAEPQERRKLLSRLEAAPPQLQNHFSTRQLLTRCVAAAAAKGGAQVGAVGPADAPGNWKLN